MDVMRMNKSDFIKRMHESRIEGSGVKGRTLVKWLKRVDEYLRRWAGSD